MGTVESIRSARHTLVAVNFGRTSTGRGTTAHKIRYDMEKATPFGRLQAEDTVSISEVLRIGQEAMDGKMYAKLSMLLHQEESKRILEGAATAEFGASAA